MTKLDPKRPPCYELFFALLQVVLDPTQYERVQFAYFASKYGHAGQIRDDGSRYFDHPKAAAWIYMSELNGRDPDVIIDILLHDLSEDQYLLSPYRITLNFGKDTALDMRAITKLPKGKETTEEYLNRVIARGLRVILAKLCDRLHNIRNLTSCSADKRQHQLEETSEYHLKMLIPELRKHDGIWLTYGNAMEVMFRQAMALYNTSP